MTLLDENDLFRTLHLFDTFEGMTPPSEADRCAIGGISASAILAAADKSHPIWAYAPLDEVRANLESTGYPVDRLHFIKGKVEQTVPKQAPHTIAVLRVCPETSCRIA